MEMPPSWLRWLAATVGAAAVAWACVVWTDEASDSAGTETVATAPTANAEPVATPAADNGAVAEPTPLAASSDGRPAGVSPEQWEALTAEMQGRPGGPAELRRLAGYFEWSDVLRRFRAGRADGDAGADLVPLAQALDDGLPERLRQAEVTAAEALQIKSALLEIIVPDESLRAEQLQQWTAATFAPAATDPRQAAFEQRQSEIVAAWSALPAAARDGATLERELDGLRRESFSTSAR